MHTFLLQRDRTLKVLPYPCIGYFSFLYLALSRHPSYKRVLELLRPASPEDQKSTTETVTDGISQQKHEQDLQRFLDLACCLGQDIRKLVYDGVPPSIVYGTDIKREFLNMGFELFRDRDRFPDPDRQFFAADLFAADAADPEVAAAGGSVWREQEGRFTVIHAGNFLHLFDYNTQLRACSILTRLLDPNPGSMIVGGQLGSSNPREVPRTGVRLTVPAQKKDKIDGNNEDENAQNAVEITTKYWHSPSTFRQMWTEVGERTGTKWDVEARFVGADMLKDAEERRSVEAFLQRLGGPDEYLMFTVTRVA